MSILILGMEIAYFVILCYICHLSVAGIACCSLYSKSLTISDIRDIIRQAEILVIAADNL